MHAKVIESVVFSLIIRCLFNNLYTASVCTFFCLIRANMQCIFEPGRAPGVPKKNQEIAKAIAINCDRQPKAKMSPRLRHFLTLLFVFAAPISICQKT
jgi:hypothetical protein